MLTSETKYGLRCEVDLPFADAVARVRDALSDEGFGILTEIDVQDTLKRKLDVNFRRYVILGACNPPLAHRALSADLDIGLLLPCNVIVYEGNKLATSVVAAIDPIEQLKITGNADIEPVAGEVRTRLERALNAIVT